MKGILTLQEILAAIGITIAILAVLFILSIITGK
jgi:hypothetical protein